MSTLRQQSLLVVLLATGCTDRQASSDDAPSIAGRGQPQAEGQSAPTASAGRTSKQSVGDLVGHFIGKRELRGALPGGFEDSSSIRNADVEAYFGPRGGTSVLSIMEHGSRPLRLRIEVPGEFGMDGSWTGADAKTRIHIDPDGQLSGDGSLDAFRIKFAGRLRKEQFSLRMTLEGLDADSTEPQEQVVYQYAMTRRQQTADRTVDAGKQPGPLDPALHAQEQKPCKVRWKLKNVTDFNGGMDLIRVPVCEPE